MMTETGLPDYIEENIDCIDAAFFSGDTFHSREGLQRIQWFVNRWQKEINSIDEMLIKSEQLERINTEGDPDYIVYIQDSKGKREIPCWNEDEVSLAINSMSLGGCYQVGSPKGFSTADYIPF